MDTRRRKDGSAPTRGNSKINFAPRGASYCGCCLAASCPANGACRTEPRLGTEQNPPCLLICVSIHLPVHHPVAILPSGTKTGLTESLHLASSAFGISGKTSREHHVRRRQSTSARRSARPSDIWYAFCYQLAAVTTRDLAHRSNHRFSSARYKKPSPRSVGRLIRSTKSGQMV